MGLLDDIENKAVTSILGGSSNLLASELLEMINDQPGGLPGLLQSFHEKGLGDIVLSWVGNGQNLPISGEQIQQVLGSDLIKQLAAKSGISPKGAGPSVAGLLPALIDKLAPNGQLPQPANLLEAGMSSLQSLNKTGTDG